MLTPVLVATTATCAVCGEVAGERDLIYAEGDDAEALHVADADMVCRDCAGVGDDEEDEDEDEGSAP